MILKKIFILSAFVLFSLLSCSSPYEKKYFVQQQNRSNKDGGNDGGITGGWEDDDVGGGEEETLPSGTLSMFAVLQKDGKLDLGGLIFDESLVSALKAKLAGGSAEAGDYSTANFNGWQIRSTFSGSNVPNFWFVSGDPGNPPQSSYSGPNSSAGSNSITDMKYYRYKGYNPLFATDSAYNKAEYTKADGSSKELIMERFEFYRFTGKGGGVAPLDNMLVAFDTYTKLIFAFAKPTKTESLLGQQVPKEWGPVDLVSTGPGGKKYKFYEYDPAGYVKSDGSVVLYKWYTDGMGRGSYDPVFTGVSPYLGTMGGTGGGGVGGGYKLSGILTIKAKYLRNDSMTDTAGDHGNADGADSPEFIYDIRARAYEGFTLPEWVSLSSFKPGDTGIMPSAAVFIKKGSTRVLGGVKQYVFTDTTQDLSLELDSRIVEIDIKGNDWVTDYETPIVYLSYNRTAQAWKPSIDNKTFLNGPVSYDSKFSVRALEGPKDFLVTLPAGGGQTMTVCYELQWESIADLGSGRIVSAELVNETKPDADESYIFDFASTEAGKYKLEYTDYSQASAESTKRVKLQLQIGNLRDATSPVTVTQSVPQTALQNITLNGSTQVSASCFGSNNTVDIEFDIIADPQGRTAELTLDFGYPPTGFDTGEGRSPKKITVSVVRNKFVKPKIGKFIISNMRITNVSLQDVGGDAGDLDGYNDPEFFWNIRAGKNKVWQEYAVMPQTSDKRISVGKTYTVGGNKSFELKETDSGIQRMYIDMEITERDRLANNDNDVICKFGQPVIYYEYNNNLDQWFYNGDTYKFFYTSSDMRWSLEKVTAPVLEKNSPPKEIVLVFSSYIADTIWPNGNIADVFGGPKPAGWGNMEVRFNLEWKDGE